MLYKQKKKKMKYLFFIHWRQYYGTIDSNCSQNKNYFNLKLIKLYRHIACTIIDRSKKKITLVHLFTKSHKAFSLLYTNNV